MHTLRTAARLTLAALSVGFGATVAPAADKKPAAPPVVKKPNGWSFPASTGWSLGASNPTSVVKSQREAGSGLATGRTKPSNLGDTATHEVGHLKGVKRR